MARARKGKSRQGPAGGEDRAERDALAQLLAAPPEEFTARRNALAKQLGADGHAALAAKVRALKRPTRPLWAVNTLAHEATDEVAALLAAADDVRDAQARVMAGKADAATLRDASTRHRQQLRSLRARAAKLLGASPSSGSAMLDRVEATLNAAASGDEALRDALRGGRLTEELEPPAFGVLGGFGAGAPAPEPAHAHAKKVAPAPAKKEKDGGRSRQDAEDRAAREAEARRLREEREREAAQARDEARAAAGALDAAERAVADAEERVRTLEDALKAAREALAHARLEARSAARGARAAAQRAERVKG